MRPQKLKGIPALAGYGEADRREDNYCQVGSFPRPIWLVEGLPNPLREAWVFGSGENGCAVRARLKCAECGCFPGRDTEVRG